MGDVMGDVSIPRAIEMPAYVAVPDGDGPWPGVVVISDVMGMTTDLRRQGDWLASAGYLAVAPDLFFRGGRVSCLRTIFRDALRGRGPTFDDIEASRAWLAARDDCTGRVGVIGFCMGGGFALMLVADHRFSVASTNYGSIPKDFERFATALGLGAISDRRTAGARRGCRSERPRWLHRGALAKGRSHADYPVRDRSKPGGSANR